MQCRAHLRELKYQTHAHSNTAQAAADVAQWKDTAKAAIASPLAGELYGLSVVKEHMQDSDENVTVFIILARAPIEPKPKDGEAILTTLLFSIRNIPAALYKALGGFATNGVNMLKLESYIPTGNKSNGAQFFLTVEGHPHEPGLKNALEELSFFCKKVKILGVYPADPKRFS